MHEILKGNFLKFPVLTSSYINTALTQSAFRIYECYIIILYQHIVNKEIKRETCKWQVNCGITTRLTIPRCIRLKGWKRRIPNNSCKLVPCANLSWYFW